MFPVLPAVMLAQSVITTPPPSITPPSARPEPPRPFITQRQEIRTLPGQLNGVPVFNSNSPEVVKGEGILLSTFAPNAKRFPNAHLNQPLSGRFDFFSHHIARPLNKTKTLHQGFIVYNPSPRPVTLKILQGISYITATDAPFTNLPPMVEDPEGRYFSGPGSRVMGDILRGRHQRSFPEQMIIPPLQSQVVFNLPIPTASARTTFIKLESDGPVYLANLVRFPAPQRPSILPNIPGFPISIPSGNSAPSLTQWLELLNSGKLTEPREAVPTLVDNPIQGEKVYGRVAGVSLGSEWTGTLVDRPGVNYLTIPYRGFAFSYPLSTVATATLGTGQNQSAPLIARYPDTAIRAHGNYGVHYILTLPLYNSSPQQQTVTLSIQTPFKQNVASNRLTFAQSPQGQVFFRGTVRFTYTNDQGQTAIRYFHLVQRQGQQGEPLVTLNLRPGESRSVQVDFLYPPDATPPQVLTVNTLE